MVERLLQSVQASQDPDGEAKQTINSHDAGSKPFTGYRLPLVETTSRSQGTCTRDTWTATTLATAPAARDGQTMVWTGTEMIVWGGGGNGTKGNYFSSSGRYNPSTDSWTATSTMNAPSGRFGHTAVRTGSETIVWGGYTDNGTINTGGRYNPSNDNWAATNTINSPTARSYHTAVWTRSEMIVWGGEDYFIGDLNTGGVYVPATDSWTATSTSNAPNRRQDHTAIWTGSEMIIWGGLDANGNELNTGGRYCAQPPTPTPRPRPIPNGRPTPPLHLTPIPPPPSPRPTPWPRPSP